MAEPVATAPIGYDSWEPNLARNLHPTIDMSEPLQVECARFLECIRSCQRPRSDGESGRRVVQVLEAAQESPAHGGVPVHMERVSTRTHVNELG
jgi:predicted dehydrogenase